MPTTRHVESSKPARRPVRRVSMVIAKGVTLRVRITSSLNDGIEGAAQRDRLSSSDWVRAVLARAVIQGAFGDWKVADVPRKGETHGPKPKRKPAP